jgi:hypothetical protein
MTPPSSWVRNWAAYALLCWATALDAWAERLVRYAPTGSSPGRRCSTGWSTPTGTAGPVT